MDQKFKFKQFDVTQNNMVFRVGTDAVLLGALADVSLAVNVLEVGTGTGIISLMLAQRFSNILISGIDIDENAVLLTQKNFHNSAFSERLISFHSDFIQLETGIKYDAIICNPPYFPPNNSSKDKTARQTIHLSMESFFKKSQKTISKYGSVHLIIPSKDAIKTIDIANEYGFYLFQKTDIYGIRNGKCVRNILEFSVNKSIPLQKSFVIEESPRKYTSEYLELTKDFHVFEKQKSKDLFK